MYLGETDDANVSSAKAREIAVEIVETTMDDIENLIALKYYMKNKQFME